MTLVSEIMTVPVLVLYEDMTLREATVLMADRGISGAPVVGAHGEMIGLLSESNILEYAAGKGCVGPGCRTLSFLTLPYDKLARDEALCLRYKSIGDAKVSSAMNDEVVTVSPDDDIGKALDTLMRFGINRVPVVDRDGKLVGIVARQNILLAVCRDARSGTALQCAPRAGGP
ncbi:CBS domain-containing protein [Methanomassiliicoccus luminyensis]|jgi:CBS domain-containing protein|uniref:CBS domain-containing protein n=1 Tax=Methanomassiliicoccus luminyensis TaxID=1080712 RepID=UPI0003675A69|nr:CBS domain-containing protein [Methanomassiliicoccus luminyensis]